MSSTARKARKVVLHLPIAQVLLRLQDWANEIGFEDMRPTWKFPRPLKNRRDRREAAEALRALNLARLVRFHAGLRTSLLG